MADDQPPKQADDEKKRAAEQRQRERERNLFYAFASAMLAGLVALLLFALAVGSDSADPAASAPCPGATASAAAPVASPAGSATAGASPEGTPASDVSPSPSSPPAAVSGSPSAGPATATSSLVCGTTHPIARGFRIFGLGVLVGGAAALVGAVLGFLFGLPRSEPAVSRSRGANPPQGDAPANAAVSTRPDYRFSDNNNLLEISDWLTKIIVGASLVNIGNLADWIARVGGRVGTGVHLSSDLAATFGASVMVYYFAWGFLFVYINTRTIFHLMLASTNRALDDMFGDFRRDMETAKQGMETAKQDVQEAANQIRENVQAVQKDVAALARNTMHDYLYSPDPGGARRAARYAEDYFRDGANQGDAWMWLLAACAYGQLHADAASPDEQKDLARKAKDALRRALELNDGLRDMARGLVYPNDRSRFPGDDDLESLQGDDEMKEIVGPVQPVEGKSAPPTPEGGPAQEKPPTE